MASLVYAWRDKQLLMLVLNRDEQPPPDFEILVQHSLPSEDWASGHIDFEKLRKLYPCTIAQR